MAVMLETLFVHTEEKMPQHLQCLILCVASMMPVYKVLRYECSEALVHT